MSSGRRSTALRVAFVAALALAPSMVARDASADLSPEAIQRVIALHRHEMRRCYQLALKKNPALAGKVTLAWTIQVDGTVANARVTRTTLHEVGVEKCLVDDVRTWRFPRPGAPARVSFPFVFASG